MKNRKIFNIITNTTLIFTGVVILLYGLLGLWTRGFDSITYQTWYCEPYIDWSIMAWPLVLIIISLFIGIVRLIKTSIPNVKTTNDKGMATFVLVLDILAIVGLILIALTYIIWPCYGGINNPITTSTIEKLLIAIRVLVVTGLSLLLIGSIVSMCFSNKVMQYKKEA